MITYALPPHQKKKGRIEGQIMNNQFTLTSPSFKYNHAIPSKHAYVGCGGKNISPKLKWDHAPAATQSFALIVDDPDAAPFHNGKTFYHWAVINIPASQNVFEEHALLSLPITQLANDYASEESGKNHKKYDGPCPPKGSGVHHYHFTVYALGQDIPVGTTHTVERLKAYLDDASNNNVLGKATLMGTYERK